MYASCVLYAFKFFDIYCKYVMNDSGDNTEIKIKNEL